MSTAYTQSLNALIEEFGKLPGIGPKTTECQPRPLFSVTTNGYTIAVTVAVIPIITYP